MNLKQQAGQDSWKRAREEDPERNETSAREQLCPGLLRCACPGQYKSGQKVHGAEVHQAREKRRGYDRPNPEPAANGRCEAQGCTDQGGEYHYKTALCAKT